MNPNEQTESKASPRVFVICDQNDTAPIWGYIIREKGMIAILETSIERAMTRLAEVTPDLIVIDINAPHPERIEVCTNFRAQSESPILLFLPASHETEILEAYQAGADECVIKPISPAIFLAKILAWARRGQTTLASGLKPVKANNLHLDPTRRSAVDSDGREI